MPRCILPSVIYQDFMGNSFKWKKEVNQAFAWMTVFMHTFKDVDTIVLTGGVGKLPADTVHSWNEASSSR